MVLSELGYHVLEAAEAEAALAILAAISASTCCSPTSCCRARAAACSPTPRPLRPALKVLFTTGYSRNAIVHHGRLDAGVQLISKPFTFDQLANRVRDLLDHVTKCESCTAPSLTGRRSSVVAPQQRRLGAES